MLTVALLMLGCKPYEVFLVSGAEQVGFTNDADILFVIDNSDSMTDEAEALGLNFNTFIGKLTSEEGANASRQTLTDAVSNYLRETTDIGLFIDYQIAVTTTTNLYDQGGVSPGIDPGEAGSLAGSPSIINRFEPNVESIFQKNLLCEATCFQPSQVPSDPSFVCPADPEASVDPGGQVTQEFLDCVCGAGEWRDHCGAGDEQPIEAAFLSLCRAIENPPDDCFAYEDPEDLSEKATQINEGDILSNEGFLRENAITLVVIVTDEGDGSPRILDGDSEVDAYERLFSRMPNPVRFAVVAPPYHDRELVCNSGGAVPWAVERYQNLITTFGGAFIDIEAQDANGDCVATDFSKNLEQIGDLLNQLSTVFALSVVPDVSTIEVFVDKQAILEAPILSGTIEAGDAVYGDGWSYDSAYNAVSFHGTAVPGFNADVKIYYRPVGGNPREIPF